MPGSRESKVAFDAASDEGISRWRDSWSLRPGVTYLNHGSFGLPPRCVREAQRNWQDRVEEEPVDFFVRVQEGELARATARLARFVGASELNIAMVDNATAAMNAVALSFPLSRSDEVLLTSLEYGAVKRIWERACRRAGANLVTAPMPFPSERNPVDAILADVTPRTRLVVVSHVFSESATIMPLEPLVASLQMRGVAVCVDGPHAVAQLPLALDDLACDFYTASCHKWLCGPLGSGFLYVAPKWHEVVEPPVLSWGRLQPAEPQSWREEFWWSGTRSLAAYLAVPAAIDFLEGIGMQEFRRHAHELAKYAAELVDEVTGFSPPLDRERWHGTMTLAELPSGDPHLLRAALWERHGIEIPVLSIGDRRFVRISAHLYNTHNDMQLLAAAIAELTRT